MFRHADIPAAQPNLGLKAPGVAIPSYRRRDGECSKPFLSGFDCTRIPAAIGTNSDRREGKSDFGASGSLPRRIPSSTRGHASGPILRPAARRRSASTASPLRGHGSSQNKFESCDKERRSNFFRAPPRKHSLALGSRAHSLTS
jgi:hypothetical protein